MGWRKTLRSLLSYISKFTFKFEINSFMIFLYSNDISNGKNRQIIRKWRNQKEIPTPKTEEGKQNWQSGIYT